jgi:polyhydroxybutyrate depolymerase
MKARTRILFAFAVLGGWATLCSAMEPVKLSWTVDGVERQALVFPPSTPPATTAAAKAPVIFAFHGHGGNMKSTAQSMKFQQLWPEAIVVYMQGLPTPSPVDRQGLRSGWQRDPGQLGDRDLKLFDAVLTTLHAKYAVNDDRVYATGFSNGSIFSLLLWGERARTLAAIGVCAGVLAPTVHLTEPRPVVHIAGRADQTALFAKQEQTMEAERRVNGCGATGQPCGTGCKRYPSTKHAPVMTIIHSGGHVYPPWASGRIVKFFKAHVLHP